MWKSKLQIIIAQSITRNKYIIINIITKKLKFIKNLLIKFNIPNIIV
jgi:hypothetical protein